MRCSGRGSGRICARSKWPDRGDGPFLQLAADSQTLRPLVETGLDDLADALAEAAGKLDATLAAQSPVRWRPKGRVSGRTVEAQAFPPERLGSAPDARQRVGVVRGFVSRGLPRRSGRRKRLEHTQCRRCVLRGGLWYGSAGWCRSAHRFGGEPSFRSDRIGFRLARGLP
jgi:hypothetical protein